MFFFRMSLRQLKKISGYDETAELKKAMGINDEDLDLKKVNRTKPKTKGGFTSAFLDIDDDLSNEVEEEEVEEDEPEEEEVKQVKPKKKRRKNKNKSAAKKEDFDSILKTYGFENGTVPPVEVIITTYIRT